MIKTLNLRSQQIAAVVLYLIALVFATGFLVTVFGQNYIKQFASAYISDRIKPAVDKSADIAEIALESPLVGKYLTPDHIESLKSEIEEYRNDPRGYIETMTSVEKAEAEEQRRNISKTLDSRPEVTVLTEKIKGWKKGIHNHFNRVYRNILKDLRIFCATNIAGFIAAGFLMWRAQCWRASYVLPSALLTFALIYSTLSYIDQNWFFNMLLDSFMGLWYPVCVAGTFGELLYRYYREAAPPQNADIHSEAASVNQQ